MNVQQAVEVATAELENCSDSANLDARIITCLACGIEQTKLITQPDQELSSSQKKSFENFLAQRSKGIPLAYITGTKEFWSLEFHVNEHVLIPRPETELLVELALNKISESEPPTILDLGTGSGAIAIAIAKECPSCNITAVDRSRLALETAKQNATFHKTDIHFVLSNWFSNIANSKFDIIISNPPYIDESDPSLDKFVYRYEPREALISKQEGLFDLAEIIKNAKSNLTQQGILMVEHGFQQAERVQKLFEKENYYNVITHKDLSGQQRCTSGCI